MPHDDREQEREFLADLEARTGRDLAAWMALIAAQSFTDKNETIDWLRAHGIPFARASWLERIHSNGGRPIYADAPTTGAPAKEKVERKAAPAPKLPTARETAQLEKLLAAAKGYRPLYLMLEAELRAAVAGLAVVPEAGYISLRAPREFAAVMLQATELRVGLDLGDRGFDGLAQKARLKGPGPAISHMAVLTDARQINAELLSLIMAANTRVNG
jgi:hypothetical protein